FCQDESNGLLIMIRQSAYAVQGEVPMTAQGEGSASAPHVPCRMQSDRSFILAENTSAGGMSGRHLWMGEGH
ncbi:MAG: hypothetical protein VX974_08030, partial [Pseudomonadota bacterium]|nr:hypothetical protein [Pseudomonadota bacterium]